MRKSLLFTLLALLGMTQMAAQEYEYVPLVREGVVWVNEKVIVNNGDTTCYYYKYEFSGYDSVETNMAGVINNACYYYTGDRLDVEKDSLIAGLLNAPNRSVTCFRNNPYYNLFLSDGYYFPVNMYLDGGTRILYEFPPIFCMYYYLDMQEFWLSIFDGEPFIRAENIKESDPVIIEGQECERCAYLDDNGNTLCYVVEGIGFDSYDMGDLLTPFTRRPDPTADYQEYCGLSHVVKDGQIIYKGMRYREGAYDAINEVVTEQPRRVVDDNYYNLMGQAVGKEVPSTPGIYIHQGRKIVVR